VTATGFPDLDIALDALVAGERSLASEPFDEESVRDMCRTCLDRTSDITSAVVNHPIVGQGPRWRERLGEIEAPTLVLHGDQDPLFPHENGERLADDIPHARFRLIPQVGHEVPRRVWNSYLDAITDHIHSGQLHGR
jgi:pimeloyl-ACP methyl ester carboxylesterase